VHTFQEMNCSVCDSSERNLLVNDTWALTGTACTHAACVQCLRQNIDDHLPRCREEQQLRVPCHAPGCRKALPQHLVLSASKAARELAAAIDEQRACPKPRICSFCLEQHPLLVNSSCGHEACETCWSQWAERQVQAAEADQHPRLCICCHPGCPSRVTTRLWREELACIPAAQRCAEMADLVDKEVVRVAHLVAPKPVGPTEPSPACPVCREHRMLIRDPGSMCDDHAACELCWARWAEGHLERCVEESAMVVRSLWPECGRNISDVLWQHLCSMSCELAELERRFVFRRHLQRNPLFPAAMQVNCPRRECVGLGYLGYDTVMCFICEHQWTPDGAVGESPPEVDVQEVMGVRVKRCPKCSEYIEKNGGCDHMTCCCTHEFYWTTLKPFRGGA